MTLQESPLTGTKMKDYYRVVEDFYPKVSELKNYFNEQFANPRDSHEKRFVWDYWYLENQYKLHRTPAYYYFPEEIYKPFEEYLMAWGQQNLGCQLISPPWISYYTDGCYQNLHADNPHGPWAYVFSLTDWDERRFTGGETQVIQPQVLEYWKHFSPERGFEREDIIKEIPSKFNQLTVFDPRLPHGVGRVEGAHEPTKSRIVIHGWFINPNPNFEGTLSDEQVTDGLNKMLEPIFENLQEFSDVKGVLVTRFTVQADGSVTNVEAMSNTLVSYEDFDKDDLENGILGDIASAKFEKTSGITQVTLPIIF